MEDVSIDNIININIGILGHVDSGKTSISKVLTTIASTACFDKHPYSQEKKITIDLGFSAFYQKISQKFNTEKKFFQYTLVDCPGHAGLIKTIIAGASIIDLMFLVIDINKGIQTQTAECLVIRQILDKQMIVILNKIDTIEEKQRNDVLQKKTAQLEKVLKSSYKGKIIFVPFSAKENIGVQQLFDVLEGSIKIPQRNVDNKFLFLLDHSFFIKGQGTVCTGTVIQGQAKVASEICFPEHNIQTKIKGIQMFRKNVQKIIQGDRCGIMVSKIQMKLERGIVSDVGVLKYYKYVVIEIQRIKYFKGEIRSQSKFHFSSNHQTVMGQLMIFTEDEGLKDIQMVVKNNNQNVIKEEGFLAKEFQYLKIFDNQSKNAQYALIEFDQEILLNQNSQLIASKMDLDLESNQCRLAFYNKPLIFLQSPQQIHMYAVKQREGVVDKRNDDYTLTIKNLFTKKSNINVFLQKKVFLEFKDIKGQILQAFGNSGKVKIKTEEVISAEDQISDTKIYLKYKKRLFYK